MKTTKFAREMIWIAFTFAALFFPAFEPVGYHVSMLQAAIGFASVLFGIVMFVRE